MLPPTAKAMATTLSISMAAYLAVCTAHAADLELSMNLKNHSFGPSILKLPANQRIKLTDQNSDTTPEKFESHALNWEKVFPDGAKAVAFDTELHCQMQIKYRNAEQLEWGVQAFGWHKQRDAKYDLENPDGI